MFGTLFPPTTAVSNTTRQTRRVPRFARTDLSVPMQFTTRDGRILEAIHSFDGVLSDHQIHALFFQGRQQRVMQHRMMLLYQHGYVKRPTLRQRSAIPTMVYWLDERGAAYVAGLAGLPVAEFSYRTEPKWATLEHDLAVNDFRIAVIQACHQHPSLSLEEWLPQGEFWAHPDKVVYHDITGQQAQRYIRPDGYFIIREQERISRLLLEVDRATEDQPRFSREKVLPGLAYVTSETYKARFGYNAGRWLVVTTSERRLRNMKAQTERAAGKDARAFYFTTFDRITSDSILTDAIWLRGGGEQPTALFTSPTNHA